MLQRQRPRRRGRSVTGPRPVATSRYSALIFAVLPSAPCASSSTPFAPAFALVTLVPVSTLMPCFLNERSSSAETASSSTGTRRGSSSMIVTSLPKRRKIDANSTPTAPLPMMAIDFGTSFRSIASSLVMIRLRSISMPGTLRGCEPVATMISFFAVSVCLLAVGDLDLALAGEPAAALDPVDLVLLEQQLDAAGQALDDLVLARLDLVHVDADRRLADASGPIPSSPARPSARARARAAPWSGCSPS